MVIRKQETFPPVTMGHIRGHGCRDLQIRIRIGQQADEALGSLLGVLLLNASGCPLTSYWVWMAQEVLVIFKAPDELMLIDHISPAWPDPVPERAPD